MIFASNFKMNHTRKSTREYIQTLQYKLNKNKKDKIYIFPSSTSIDNFNVDFKIGVQNAYPSINGNFTGEIGLEQLNEFNIKTILIGHSERRNILNETRSEIIKKFSFFEKNKFEIIYCIGEPKEIKNLGDDEVIKYLSKQLKDINLNYENLIIAYEPIWAIGTGKPAKIEDIKKIHNEIKKQSKKPLLYGGSVNLTNIKSILEINNVDGVLIGNASLDIDIFLKMIN